jgi:ATP-binding cassette subfamily B protein
MLLRLLRNYLRPFRAELGGLVLLQLLSTIATLYLPHLNADIIDVGVVRGDTGYIVGHGGWMLGISFGQILAAIGATYLAARVSMGFGRQVRAALFSHVGEFSAQEVARFGAPTLISRNTNDVTQVQTILFMGLAIMLSAPIMMVGGVIMALKTDAPLSLLLVIAVPVLAIAVGLIIARMVPQFREMQESLDQLNRILREQITGVRVVRAFVREEREEERFGEANQRLTTASLIVGRLMARIFPTVVFLLNASSVAVIWFGGHRIASGGMEVGSLTAYLSYLVQILMSVMMAAFMSSMIPRAAVSAERIVEVLDTPSSIAAPPVPRHDFAPATDVTFESVDFAYPGAEVPVLTGVTFTARAGHTTAIIGSTGAGKTTLLSLVPRLMDVTAGSVSVGGVDVREAEPEELWSRLGWIPQRPFLFSGTVASNLRFGKADATEEEMWEALRIAQAEDFVRAMDDGLESPIAQGGTNVSGGQRQRLAIARAVIRRPAVYLFDDSFSALDLATDARLRAALEPVTRDAAVLVVAQRVSTIVDADHIVVLDDGVVVGQGSHEELADTCPTYQEIVASQQAVAA